MSKMISIRNDLQEKLKADKESWNMSYSEFIDYLYEIWDHFWETEIKLANEFKKQKEDAKYTNQSRRLREITKGS